MSSSSSPAEPFSREATAGPRWWPTTSSRLIDVMNFPGFLQLSPENMYVVANTPLNLQWLSYIAAAALASPSMAQIIGPLDEGWLLEQALMQARVRGELEQLIRQLLAGQP